MGLRDIFLEILFFFCWSEEVIFFPVLCWSWVVTYKMTTFRTKWLHVTTAWWPISCQRQPSYDPLSCQWRPKDDPKVISKDQVTTHLVVSEDSITTCLLSIKDLTDDSDNPTDNKSWPDYKSKIIMKHYNYHDSLTLEFTNFYIILPQFYADLT